MSITPELHAYDPFIPDFDLPTAIELCMEGRVDDALSSIPPIDDGTEGARVRLEEWAQNQFFAQSQLVADFDTAAPVVIDTISTISQSANISANTNASPRRRASNTVYGIGNGLSPMRRGEKRRAPDSDLERESNKENSPTINQQWVLPKRRKRGYSFSSSDGSSSSDSDSGLEEEPAGSRSNIATDAQKTNTTSGDAMTSPNDRGIDAENAQSLTVSALSELTKSDVQEKNIDTLSDLSELTDIESDFGDVNDEEAGFDGDNEDNESTLSDLSELTESDSDEGALADVADAANTSALFDLTELTESENEQTNNGAHIEEDNQSVLSELTELTESDVESVSVTALPKGSKDKTCAKEDQYGMLSDLSELTESENESLSKADGEVLSEISQLTESEGDYEDSEDDDYNDDGDENPSDETNADEDGGDSDGLDSDDEIEENDDDSDGDPTYEGSSESERSEESEED